VVVMLRGEAEDTLYGSAPEQRGEGGGGNTRHI
jgi:hypothetical protein